MKNFIEFIKKIQKWLSVLLSPYFFAMVLEYLIIL